MDRLIKLAANDPSRIRSDASRDQFAIDANAVLEAMLLEYGIEAAVRAVANQGFKGDYRPVISPLFEFAVQRRAARPGPMAAPPNTKI